MNAMSVKKNVMTIFRPNRETGDEFANEKGSSLTKRMHDERRRSVGGKYHMRSTSLDCTMRFLFKAKDIKQSNERLMHANRR